MITNSLNLLGEVRQRQGQLEQARNFYCECLAIAYEIGDKACIAHILHHLGTLAQSQTEHERAVRLFAVAATMRGMAAGLVFHTLVAPTDQPAGLAGVKEALAGFYTAFSDIQIEIEQIMIDGDYVTVRQVARGTHDHDFLGIPATGKPVVITSHDIYRVEDGMMVEVWHVEDLLNTLLQIGAFPPAGK